MASFMEDPAWMPECSASLRTVASVDTRPDTVEDVLNVCPHHASRFRGRHLRLAWVDSPPDPNQGWPGRSGPARVRVDTALRPQDPAVLIMPDLTAAARDPVVDLRTCAIPPHYVQPWATVEVLRDSSGAGDKEEEERRGGGVRPHNLSTGGGGGGTQELPLLPRPESALELLRGCVVKTGGVAHLLLAPTDPACRGVRLLCRRAPEFVVPSAATVAPAGSAAGRRSSKSDCERYSGGKGRRRGEEERGTRRQQGARTGGTEVSARSSGVEPGAGEEVTSGRTRQDVSSSTATAAATAATKADGGGCVGATGKSGADWACRLSEWGVVTAGSEVVVPHKALEVWYHDVTAATGDVTASAAAAAAAAATAAAAAAAEEGGRPPPAGEPGWVETILRSHEPSVVQDLSAGLELEDITDGGGGGGGGGGTVHGFESGAERKMAMSGGGGGGGGALLVHGPPGVGKTRLVEALAIRLGCRLVKVSPGRLAAAAGVRADRVLMEAFRYCRQCVSHRVLLLLDSMDRLTPSAEGNVGASRGEVDAAVLNAFVLAVEQGRRDPRWRGRVAVVGVTSWPDQVHPTARRCAGQELLVLPPSQPLRTKILMRALMQVQRGIGERRALESSEEKDNKLASNNGDEAFGEVVGLCQGFTAGDMCAVAAATAAALELSSAGRARTQPRSGPSGIAVREGGSLSLDDALRSGFRQVRERVAAERGGTGGGGGSGGGSVFGVPCVRWSEVGGLERAKRAVQEMVVWPARFPEVFSRMGITPASGVLLFGPPGTGKTLLAKAAATETGATFIELKISDVVRGEIGESEKAVDRAFRTARELAPSIIFIDEFQALFASRDAGGGTGSRLASQLLVCMDELARWRTAGLRDTSPATTAAGDRGEGSTGTGNHVNDGESRQPPSPAALGSISQSDEQGRGNATVMVLAATNAPEAVDAAFLRPGRFDEIVYAGLPDAEGRKHILQAAKARMEGLHTRTETSNDEAAAATVAAATDSAQVSPPTDDIDRVDNTALLPEAPAGEGGATAAVAASVSFAHAPAARSAAVVTPPPASKPAPAPAPEVLEPEERATRKTPVSVGGSIIGGGGGGKSGVRVEGGRGGGRWASDVDAAWLSCETKGFSGADLSSLVRNAAMVALREEGETGDKRVAAVRPEVGNGSGRRGVGRRARVLVLARRHFETALASTEPSSGPEAVAKHERWARQWHVAP